MRIQLSALLLASTVFAQNSQTPPKTAPQQGPPPKHLMVRPDGHVTANQDPTDPEKFEVHVVQHGDTLSAISSEVLKNPRLWPQLWEQNEHIINPHWIYPNDKILIKPITVLSEAKPPEPDPEPVPPPPPPPVVRRSAAPPPQQPPAPAPVPQNTFTFEDRTPVSEVKFEDLYCSGFVQTAEVKKDLRVISKFDSSGGVLATEPDYVYLGQGSNEGITAGNVYQVVRRTKELDAKYETEGNHNIGTHYLDVGQVRVVLVQPEFSLAHVIHNCADALDVGDVLMPFQQIVLPARERPRPFSPTMTTNSGVKGNVVSSKTVLLNFGSAFKGTGKIPGVHRGHLGREDRGLAPAGEIVYINIGQDNAVKPGDVFIAYRDVYLDKRLYHYPHDSDDKLRSARRAIGELLVVKVGERGSTALVTYASDALALGDAVERR
jgi:hypothetical protein